jgi:hypothetical protein
LAPSSVASFVDSAMMPASRGNDSLPPVPLSSERARATACSPPRHRCDVTPAWRVDGVELHAICAKSRRLRRGAREQMSSCWAAHWQSRAMQSDDWYANWDREDDAMQARDAALARRVVCSNYLRCKNSSATLLLLVHPLYKLVPPKAWRSGKFAHLHQPSDVCKTPGEEVPFTLPCILSGQARQTATRFAAVQRSRGA